MVDEGENGQRCAQNEFFIAQNVFFIAQNVFFIVQNVFFIVQNVFFIVQNVFFIVERENGQPGKVGAGDRLLPAVLLVATLLLRVEAAEVGENNMLGALGVVEVQRGRARRS